MRYTLDMKQITYDNDMKVIFTIEVLPFNVKVYHCEINEEVEGKRSIISKSLIHTDEDIIPSTAYNFPR